VSPGRQFGTALRIDGGSTGVPTAVSSLKVNAIGLLPPAWSRTAQLRISRVAVRLVREHGVRDRRRIRLELERAVRPV
jgi:hypothetical protein